MRLSRWALAAFFAAFLIPSAAQAQLSFSLRTGDDGSKSQQMVFDSNKCNSGEGPRAMYVGGRVENSGGTVRTNVTATLSGVSGNFFLAGGQSATLKLGSIAPGQSAGAYWFIGYGCSETSISPIVSISSAQGPGTSATLSLSGWKAISANATGFLDATVLGPGAVVGQVINLDVQYSFGQSNAGDTVYFQPSGVQAFNAGCFRLVSTTILSSSKISGVPVGTVDRIFFTLTGKGNKGEVEVRYAFAYMCEGASTQARPYAMGKSGQQLKYTGNYDTDAQLFTISFPGATNPFVISKTAHIASAPSGKRHDVTYTVTVTNPSPYNSVITGIADNLPAGATFKQIEASSDVQAANSSSVPATAATDSVSFEGIQDQSYAIAAGGSVNLIYTVSMPEEPGTYSNSAQAVFGLATTANVTADFVVTPPEPLTVEKTSEVAEDPVNGTEEPFAIPGADITYTIEIANPNPYQKIDADSLVITDVTPEQLWMVLNGTPAELLDGSNATGLQLIYSGLGSTTDDIDFSNDGGATWTYVPSPDANGIDRAVTAIRLRPRGEMAANSSFALKVSYRLR